MQVIETSSLQSLYSSDSLRDAFASLDAASANRSHQHSISSLPDSTSHSYNDAATASSSAHVSLSIAIAQRQQFIQHGGVRALCGGANLKQMRKEVIERSEKRSKRYQDQCKNLTEKKSIAVQSDAPIFKAFHMSIEDGSYSQGVESEPRGGDDEGESKRHLPTSRQNSYTNSDGLPLTSTLPPTLTSNTTNAPLPKAKRTLEWATKRDKRIARRRHNPPLTRSQARQQGTQEAIVQQPTNFQQPSLAISDDVSADITEPSYGTINSNVTVVSDRPRRAKGMSKKVKTPPVLDMTFTEQGIRSALDREGESLLSSQTQSDSSSQDPISVVSSKKAIMPTQRQVLSKKTGSESSETEEEEDDSEVPQASKQRIAVGEEQTQGYDGAKAKSPKQRKVALRSDIPKQRVSSKLKGPPLFQDVTFMLFGFWAKVKVFEGLIEKHSGIVIKVKNCGELSAAAATNIQYLISCTHSGSKPSSMEIDKWKTQLIKVSDDRPIVERFFYERKLIQAEWISDCIAQCLQKDALLSMDKYVIGVN